MDYQIRFDIKVFEFMGDHCGLPDRPKAIKDPRDMMLYWESTSKLESPELTNHRLFIIQDLHPRLIEILGVLLDIPPEFFLAHCEEFASLGVSSASGASQGSSAYWKVPVPRRYDVPDSWNKRVPGSYYAKLGNFNLEATWDSSVSHDLKDCSSLRDIPREFKLESSLNDTIQPHKQRIFDTATEAYDQHDIITTNDPFSASILIRNIVRFIWDEFVNRLVIGIYDARWDEEEEYSTKRGLQRSSSRINHEIPSNEKYHRLLGETNGSHPMLKGNKNDPMAKSEHESWTFLEARLEAAEITLGNHLEMFAQHSALVHSEAANMMARSSGQLTKIAIVIVPCSFVASIFSMGGNFAAGESLFFVYWTVSLPITLVLLTWVLSKDKDSIDFFERTLSPVLRKCGQKKAEAQKPEWRNGIRRRWGRFKRGCREQELELGEL
ncbi:unnamed protein product [Fusarium venenatum]|uniref:Uncharacterized protein n=2 Tax=Fusarium venenatum TaxID=56646 RepID=A0A2L2TH36_9HYPO|nr:uncharacterized protein FVRRES_10361 [Fusarium venenatum]CEI70284.1 unnamed protein product [Fusarium venenatum]